MPRNFAPLRKLLCELYDDHDLARLAARDAGLTPANIREHSSLTVYWQNILEEAEKQGLLEGLLAKARAEYPAQSAELVLPPDEPDRGANLTSQQVRVGLRKLLETHFNLDGLRNLCFDMGIQYENLPGGDVLGAKARELILYCERHLRVGELIEMGREARPELPWPALS
jgi:hypothetical protein